MSEKNKMKTFRIRDKPPLKFNEIENNELVLLYDGNYYRSTTLENIKRFIDIPGQYGKGPNEPLYSNPTLPIIQHGVLNCQYFSKDDNQHNYPKPGFLQANRDEVTSTLNLKFNNLRLVFSLGLLPGGDYNGLPNTVIKPVSEDQSWIVNNSCYLYAEIDDPDDETVKFDFLDHSNKFYYQEEEPENPEDNTHWFDVKNNLMRVYDENKQEWINKLRIILAFLGTTPDGYLGCILSYVPNASSGQYSHFDIINENVFDNETAMQAIVDSEIAIPLECALEFDGVDDYVDLGTPSELQLSNNAPFTWEGWVYFRSFSSRDMLISKNNGRSGSPYDYLLGSRENNSYITAYDGSNWQDVSYSLSSEIWIHMAFSFDGSDMTFFIDGENIGSTSFSWSLDTSLNIKIGGYNSGSDIDGYYADIRLWDHARTQTEIQDNMNKRLVGNEEGLVGYWPMKEGSGSTVYDESTNNNDGTIHGATWVEVSLADKFL